MANKKTLTDIKKFPIDFLYLWAGDNFISQLGNKASIIAEKKYNQYQTLWRIMVDNEDAGSAEANQEVFTRWTNEIATAIREVYGRTPAEILIDLASGKTVAGKDFSSGIFGIGETPTRSFVQNSNYTVDPATGQIMAGDGATIKDKQTPIYGENGDVIGYSYTVGGKQYQSVKANNEYVAYTYSDASGVQKANGGSFSASQGTFWQNAENYMPMINNVLDWVMSLVNQLLPSDRVVLTSENTTPKQTEWMYEEKQSNGGIWIAIAAAGAALFGGSLFTTKKNKKSKKN